MKTGRWLPVGVAAAFVFASLFVLASGAAAAAPPATPPPSSTPKAAQAAPTNSPAATAASAANTIIGESVRGLPLEVGCIGTGERMILLVGGMHTGSEIVSTELALAVAELIWTGDLVIPADLRVCLLPAVNPDGVASGGHRNANDVDLNRNWPAAPDWRPLAYHPDGGLVSGGAAPLSEPETRALYDYVSETRPSVVIVWHCCAPVVEASESPRAVMLAHRYASAAGLEYIDQWSAYAITGEFIDAMDRIGIPAIDVEIERPDDIALTQHRAGLLAVFDGLAQSSTVTKVVPPRLPDAVSTATRAVSDTAAPSRTVYRIQAGDTLANIAARFGTTAWVLARENGISNVNLIEVGHALTVPVR